MKYHVNSKGEAAECHASVKPCPLGGEHYGTLDDAQFAAELSQLLGEKLSVQPTPKGEPLLNPTVESKRVLKLVLGSAHTHQLIRALNSDEHLKTLTAAASPPQVGVDAGMLNYHRAEMLKLVTERYFAQHSDHLAALPPADVFSEGELLEAGSAAESYTMARGTLDQSVAQINHVRLLAGGDARNLTDSDFLRRQGELTVEMALEKIAELTRNFDAGMRERMAFVQVMESQD